MGGSFEWGGDGLVIWQMSGLQARCVCVAGLVGTWVAREAGGLPGLTGRWPPWTVR